MEHMLISMFAKKNLERTRFQFLCSCSNTRCMIWYHYVPRTDFSSLYAERWNLTAGTGSSLPQSSTRQTGCFCTEVQPWNTHHVIGREHALRTCVPRLEYSGSMKQTEAESHCWTLISGSRHDPSKPLAVETGLFSAKPTFSLPRCHA